MSALGLSAYLRLVFFITFYLLASVANAFECEGIPLSLSEREGLLEKLRISNAGKKLIQSFTEKYGSIEKLQIQWNHASFSEILNQEGRSPAGVKSGRPAVCIHLASKLPEIEHVADLAHELTHATRMDAEVLRGNVKSTEEFVRSRLASHGGEADAFSVECKVKFEILKEWDSMCAPYVSSKDEIDAQRVLQDLYNGQLSASLTGEPYPVMLAKQFKRAMARRNQAVRQTNPLEYKKSVQ